MGWPAAATRSKPATTFLPDARPSTDPEFGALPWYIIDALQVADQPDESACSSPTVLEDITPENLPSDTQKSHRQPRL